MTMPGRVTWIAAAASAVALAAAVTSLWHDSPIVDEVPHLFAGYSYLRTGSLRLNPEHPPLVKDLAALPLLFLYLDDKALLPRFTGVADEDQWTQGTRFLEANGTMRLMRAARLPLLIFYMGAAWLVFLWGRVRYGEATGLLAFLLFTFSPTVLAHARFVTMDVAAAAGTMATIAAFLAHLRGPTRRTAAVAVAALGVALLIKFSAALLVVWMLMAGALGRGWRGVRAAAVIAALGGLLVVWPFYLLHMAGDSAREQRAHTQEMLERTLGEDAASRAALWASDKPLLRAASQYATGLLLVAERSGDRHPVFFFGKTRPSGNPWYFPAVYLLKETLGWWLLVVVALMGSAGLVARGRPRLDRAFLDRHRETLALLLWLGLYWALCLRATLNLGVRHLLPTYPVAALLVAAAIASFLRPRSQARPEWRAVWVLAAYHVLATLWVHPSYLAFFNALAGGPDGGRRYAVDSNLDWGQDLERLAAWTRERGIDRISVDYFGGDAPRRVLPQAVGLSEKDGTRDGWIAVSVTTLQQSLGSDARGYAWLADQPPDAVIGHSIAVWNRTRP